MSPDTDWAGESSPFRQDDPLPESLPPHPGIIQARIQAAETVADALKDEF